MKYVASWTARLNGSAQQNEAAGARIVEVLAKWSPPESFVIHQFVTRVDGNGGFAVIETDDVASIALTCAKFAPYLDFQVYPVLDYEAGVALLAEAAQFRDSTG